MADVESLELQIKGNATSAQKSINALIETLDKLKKATAGACGLDKVASEMGKIKNINIGLSAANSKSAKSFSSFGTKALFGAVSLHKVTDAISSWMDKSNDYVENLNLFTVAMGEYAEAAQEYAETVGEAMGIDPSAWMRNQGVFMTLATGFGVASDRAATMSTQLTQLGYDISSFFNVSVEDAMQKLQSGLAGELEPLRRLGYDLSQAKLEAVALSLGIDKTFESMTQAEKAQLRYYAIMTQVTKAQGDMSRTLSAPANQLRILKAQVEQAARALGNIFIPALNAVLPYAIALMRVIRELANTVASFFGFKLTEVDYSGLTDVSSSATEASDSIDGATASAKKLKKALLGIDELNVMSDPNAGGGGAGAGGGAFDFELPTYNFMSEITNNIDKAYKKVKKLLTPLKKILEALVEYKDLVLVGAGLAALGKLWNKLQTFWTWFKGLKLVKLFTDGFAFIKGTGGSTFQSLVGGLDNIRLSLSGVQKAGLTAIAAFTEFSIIKNNMHDIAAGCENVGGKLVGVGAAATGASVVMYAALGPAGIVMGAIVGLLGAVVGVEQAFDDVRTAISNEVFYSGTGVRISDLANAFSQFAEVIVSTNQPIIDNQAKIDDLRGSVTDTIASVNGIAWALTLGSATASEKIEEIKTLFGQLKTDTKTIMDEIYNNIVAAVGGSFGAALIEAGESIPEVLAILEQIRGEGVDTLTSLQTELNNLTLDLESGKITQEEFETRWMEIESQLNSLIGVTDEYTGVFNTLKDSIGNINWEDEEAKNNFFSQVTASSTEAKDSINQASDSIIASLETMKNWTTDDNLKAKIDDWIKIAAADRNRQLNSVDEELTILYDAVQEDMIRKSAEVKERAVEEWNDMGWFGQWWNGSETKYVSKALTNYQKNIVKPINKEIDTSFETLGVEGSAWADTTMTKIIGALFNWNVSANNTYAESYRADIQDTIEYALEEAGIGATPTAENVGESVTSHVGDGIESVDLTKSVDTMMANGLSEKDGKSYGTSFANAVGGAMCGALKKIKLPTVKGTMTTSTSGSVTYKFSMYANGGFPESGEVFLARENGIPEMVGSIGSRTAVANNDQIVESVSRGVYQAVVSAMGQSGGTQVVEAKVNDKVLFEVVVDRNRRETIRTGASPLLGGV